MTCRQDNVISLPLQTCLGHGNRTVVGAVEGGNELAHAIGRIAGDHADIVFLTYRLRPFDSRIFDDARRDLSS